MVKKLFFPVITVIRKEQNILSKFCTQSTGIPDFLSASGSGTYPVICQTLPISFWSKDGYLRPLCPVILKYRCESQSVYADDNFLENVCCTFRAVHLKFDCGYRPFHSVVISTPKPKTGLFCIKSR
jgi:hypothetical protein